MSEEDTDPCRLILLIFLILITGAIVAKSSPEIDRQVMLELKTFLLDQNKVNRGRYTAWDEQKDHCQWPDITCMKGRVTGISLNGCNMSGKIFENFSALTELSELDLSANTIGGTIPADLSKCSKLNYLNLSHNLIGGALNLTGLNNLEVLDLANNRLTGEIQASFPAICGRLINLNISSNRLVGRIDNCFDECQSLQYLDLSSNNFNGQLWLGFPRLREFSVSENYLSGEVPSSIFTQNCNLKVMDLSQNNFSGEAPRQIGNCRNLSVLVLWGNKFSGKVPAEIGLLSNLQVLLLGNNSFVREIPEELLNCPKLTFLDLSKNNFGGDIQKIFGRFLQVKFLVLHGNSYTGGIYSSGILKLPNITRLDLSFNNFSGPIPVELSTMPNLKFLFLAYNEFNGSIPAQFGNLSTLQALDLSYNKLTGPIPPTIGMLSSLLWLMLANNSLSGDIPPQIGNCGSLLWLNLANNQLSGKLPPQLSKIGLNVTATFERNRQNPDVPAGSGECLAMKRWLPANYPPFSFVYDILTRKSCRATWDKLLKGYGLFPLCVDGSTVRTLKISGYLQLSGNQLSGEIPPEIGDMKNFSLLHLGVNSFSGELTPEIRRMPLVVLNISYNKFSGEIPSELGQVQCLQNLDLSFNNFSGVFPTSLNNLTDLSKFNVSYNPLISGVLPTTGQLATFEQESFLGDPLLYIPSVNTRNASSPTILNPPPVKEKRSYNMTAFLLYLGLTLAFIVCGVLSVFCFLTKHPADPSEFLLEDSKYRHDIMSSSGSSSPITSDSVKVIHLHKTSFTYADILRATGNFSEERIIGKGGFGIVYRGTLPDGREVAMKKLQREGLEGEREFRAEMEVLSNCGIGWPHPNLVTLYGWCLNGSEKLLVYEYMEGGSLDDLLCDRTKLTWQRRVQVAIDVARALVFLHHECYPSIVHRDVKASNVLLDREGMAHVTDFGLARMVDAGETHVSTIVAGTIGYVAPEYGQSWKATTKGDVYSFGVLVMELATGRRAVDGGEECLLEWARRVIGDGRQGLSIVVPVAVLGLGLVKGAEEMCELLKIGLRCTAEAPQARPNMKEVLAMLIKVSLGH